MSPYEDHSEVELVSLMRAGDRRAFEAIYRRYAGPLYRYARKNVTIPEDCEEMVQDIFVSLWVRRQTLLVESLSNYLLRSIRYMIIRYFSHRGVIRKFADHYRLFEAIYDSANDEYPQHDPHAIHSLLLQQIQKLPDRCQEAIRLRLTENLTNSEIAERMNINKSTVQLYISKAFAYLRGSYNNIFKPAE